jgi:putative DNA primase/helicase
MVKDATADDGRTVPDASLQASAKAVRYVLIGRPLPLPENGQPYGPHTPTLTILSATFAADGADAARRLWQTTLRHQDPELTTAVEGRLARAGDPAEIKCTDFGNAERLVLRYGHDLRYCYPWRSWLWWDGRRWQRDQTGEVVRRAKATVQGIYAEAAETQDRERREALAKWAVRSEGDQRLKAMIEQAKSEPGIPVVPDALDADPWLLNCLDGTVDLRTATLRPPRQADLITKLAPVHFDREARCPIWERFVAEVLQGKADLIAFVRRAMGYSLTGDTRERVLFICHGAGRNGKSTLLEVIAELLGDYALRTPTETFMVKYHGQVPNDVAQLPGRRFVHASESDEGKRLAEAFIKDVTGRDTISARFMRGEWFQFRPVCKLWLRTNHRPTIRGTDHGIWDRIRLVPFEVRFDEGQDDKTLPEKLRAELPGILGWLLQGCLSWQTNGLGLPEAVSRATQAYRAEQDVLGDFLAECCALAPAATVRSAELFAAYRRWCEQNSEPPLGRKALAGRLQERGLSPARGSFGVWIWRGIGLQSGQSAGDT